MTQLFDVLVQVARACEALIEREATGGSTTTIVDSRLNTLGHTNDAFNGGTAFIIRDAGGLGAAPEKQSRFVSDYVGSSGTITVDPAFSAAPVATDIYGVTTNRYPRAQMASKVNAALALWGDVPTEDAASLTTLSATREYSLPVAAKKDLRQVWLARSLSAPWDWEPQLTVRFEHGAANAVGNLIFERQPRVGYKIKLVYMAAHPYVAADADYVSDYVSADWLALEAAIGCVRERMQAKGANQKQLTPLINDLMTRAAEAKSRRRMDLPQPFPKLPYTS